MSAENKKMILLVDDEAIIAMTEKMILEKYGYKVIIANTGEEAVATVAKTPGIDLILMDINLGAGIDGPEAAAIILRQRDLPVVFLSSHTEPEVVEKTEKITSYGYVVKNSSSTVLDASIKMAFKLFEAKTKEQEKEDELCKSEEKFKQLFTQMPSAVAIYDAVDGGEDFVFKDFNVAAEKIEGIKKDDLVGKRVTQVFPGVKDFGIFAVLQRVWRTGQPEFFPSAIYRNEREPGTWRENWVYKLVNGEVIAIYNDVTARKQAEEAVFQSKKDWEDCFDSITDMITIHDNDYNIIRANKAGKALLKLPEFENNLKLKCFSFYHGTDAAPAGCPSCDCLKNGMPGVFELFEPHLNRYLEIRAIPRFDSNNQRAGLIHIVRDITERKRVESQGEATLEVLHESEKRLKDILFNMADWVWEVDKNGVYTYSSERVLDFLGISCEEIIGKTPFDSMPPDEVKRVAPIFSEIMANKALIKDLENWNIGRNGKRICILTNGVPILDEKGNLLGYRGVDKNITERKRAEEEKEQIISLQKATIESTADGILVIDHTGKITDFNQRFARMWRIPDSVLAAREDEQALRFVLGQLLDPQGFLTKVNELYAAPEQESFDLLLLKDGRYFERYSRPQLISGRPLGRVWSFRDISARRQAEKALRESEERFRTLYENISLGLYRTTPDGKILLANPALVKMLGYSSFADLANKNLEESGFDLSYTRAQFIENIEKNGEVKELECAWKRNDGITIIVRESALAIRDAQGKTMYYDGIVEDITESKQSKKLTEALYGISQAIYTSVTLNELYQRIHGLISNVVPADNLFIALLSDDGKVLTFPYFIDEKDTGDRSVIEVDNSQSLTVEVFKTKNPLLLDEKELLDRYASGRNKVWVTAPKCWLGVPLMIRETVIGVMVVQDYHKCGVFSKKDVTLLESAAGQIAIAIDRKRAEEEIKRQLTEKETLLKEVHHRIKNNIASIGGLISLRLQSISNPEAIAVLKDTIGRIDSMRILYDKLLLSEDYKDLAVKNYIESLIDTVVILFPDSARVTLEKHIADFQLDSKRLFPFGIIINELLTNIMKYAFINKDTGLIQISLTNIDKHVTLTLQDNGSGLPDGFHINESKGFGLMLVKMLCQQLGGSFSMESHKGTRCKIEFNI